MYSCTLIRHVIAKDAEADFERHIELPFVPSLGMQLFVDTGNGRFDVIRVETVNVFTPGNKLEISETLYFGDDCECKPEDSCCLLEISLMIEEGWTLFGEVRRKSGRRNLTSPWIYK